MNERHFRRDEAELPEQAGQIEAERVIDSAELLMACEQRSEPRLARSHRL
jgi:hypothetical protein